MRRREFLGAVTASVVAGAAVGKGQAPQPEHSPPSMPPPARKGRIKQGVTRGVFARGTPLEDCCREAARLGIKGFDLIGPADWPTLKKYGLVPSMYPGGPGGTIPVALNRKENHERLLEPHARRRSTKPPPTACRTSSRFSGNRNGMADAEGRGQLRRVPERDQGARRGQSRSPSAWST